MNLILAGLEALFNPQAPCSLRRLGLFSVALFAALLQAFIAALVFMVARSSGTGPAPSGLGWLFFLVAFFGYVLVVWLARGVKVQEPRGMVRRLLLEASALSLLWVLAAFLLGLGERESGIIFALAGAGLYALGVARLMQKL